jgi:hypothetical protein
MGELLCCMSRLEPGTHKSPCVTWLWCEFERCCPSGSKDSQLFAIQRHRLAFAAQDLAPRTVEHRQWFLLATMANRWLGWSYTGQLALRKCRWSCLYLFE